MYTKGFVTRMALFVLLTHYTGFTYEHFQSMDIPELMIKIWQYSYEKQCNVCLKYQRHAIKALREKWTDQFIDKNFVIYKLCKQDKDWCDLDKPTETEKLGKIITKNKNVASILNLI